MYGLILNSQFASEASKLTLQTDGFTLFCLACGITITPEQLETSANKKQHWHSAVSEEIVLRVMSFPVIYHGNDMTWSDFIGPYLFVHEEYFAVAYATRPFLVIWVWLARLS